jgi:hypothetical protein
MPLAFELQPGILDRTFAYFRDCGRGCRECQVLWTSSWDAPTVITSAVHSKHLAYGDGFILDDAWLSKFWLDLAENNHGIRIQVHTHPRAAFHSPTDDRFPIIHKPGFLSLVIPNFGLGPVGFDGAYLAEVQLDGNWREVPVSSRLISL